MATISYKYLRIRATKENSSFDPTRIYYYKCSKFSLTFQECKSEFLSSSNPTLVTKLPNGKFIECDNTECLLNINSIEQLNEFYFTVSVYNIENSNDKRVIITLTNSEISSTYEFGYSIFNDITKVTNWQSTNQFNDVVKGKYYWFVRNKDTYDYYTVYNEVKDVGENPSGWELQQGGDVSWTQ